MQLTVRDVVRLLGVSEKDVYRWIRQGSLPAYRVQDRYGFNRAELLEWAISRRMPIACDLIRERGDAGSPLPSFVEALEAGGITRRVGGDSKETVLRALVGTLQLSDGVDHDFLFRVLLARETLGSTAVGDGIAIPHVRNPVVLRIAKPSVHLCFLEKPIDFSAPDGRPVHTLFLVLSPTVRTHLHLLARLAFALRDPGFKGMVLSQGSNDGILREVRRVEASFLHPHPAGGRGGA